MKICMFSYSECDKYYITVRRVAKVLVNAGHEVTVIAIRNTNNTRLELNETSEGFRIIRIENIISKFFKIKLINYLKNKYFNQGNTADSGQPFINNVMTSTAISPPNHPHSKLRKTVFYIPNWLLVKVGYRFMPYLLYADYYCQAYKTAKKLNADVYHAHDLVTLPVGWYCRRRKKGRLIYDMHELWLERSDKKRFFVYGFLLKRLESFLIKRTDSNIMAGYSSAKELVKWYGIKEPVVLLNVPEYREYAPSTLLRDDLKIPAGQKILLYAGILNHSRGLEEMIESLAFTSGCCLVLVGMVYDPRYGKKLKELIAQEGLTDRVYFHEPVLYNEVSKYAMSADVGLALHQNIGLNYYYVSPLKLFEYMGAGLPIVGSNFPDVKRFVEGYKFGVTCDPTSPQAIAEAVKYILADEKRYQEMRHNAIEAARIFNWETESKKLMDIYNGFNIKQRQPAK